MLAWVRKRAASASVMVAAGVEVVDPPPPPPPPHPTSTRQLPTATNNPRAPERSVIASTSISPPLTALKRAHLTRLRTTRKNHYILNLIFSEMALFCFYYFIVGVFFHKS
jgi:hypothetical protein